MDYNDSDFLKIRFKTPFKFLNKNLCGSADLSYLLFVVFLLSEVSGNWCKSYVTNGIFLLTDEFVLFVHWSCCRGREKHLLFKYTFSNKVACAQSLLN